MPDTNCDTTYILQELSSKKIVYLPCKANPSSNKVAIDDIVVPVKPDERWSEFIRKNRNHGLLQSITAKMMVVLKR